jgi:hypothetical protein
VPSHPPDLVVGGRGAWLEVRGRRHAVSNPILARILSALADLRISAPGAPISHDFLYMSAWPGKLPTEDLVMKRLEHAFLELSRLGLEGMLIVQPGCAWLDPQTQIIVQTT